MQPSTREILFGCDEPPEPEIALQAGPLTMLLRGTQLLYLRIGDAEIWHGVSFLFRDVDWGTPLPVVEHVEHESKAEGFSVRLVASIATHPPIDLRISIDGQPDGTLRYQATSTARGELATNRTGLCVMHPLEVIGHAVTVTHDDGRETHSTFPRLIAPWPPFMSVRAIRHEWSPGRWAECQLEGDGFEFEDQRNNCDASFKTYNRSNMMPRPYRLRAGQVVTQSVTLRLLEASEAARSRPAHSEPRTLQCSPRKPGSISLGIGISASDCSAAGAVIERLRQLRPRHLHLHLTSPDEHVDWAGLGKLLKATQSTLRLDVLLGAADSRVALALLATSMRASNVQAEAVAVFPSTPPVMNAARQAFSGYLVGGGTQHFFTQLNRAEDLGELDFISFTTSALVHGADDDAIMDGLHSLPFMLETLAARFPAMPVRVGPSAIPARASPLGSQPASDGRQRVALARRDPRTRGLFGAAWMLGYVAQLASTDVQAITLMHLQGDAGLLQGDDASPVPAFFVLQALQDAQEMAPIPGLPSGVCGVRFTSATQSYELIANLRNKPVTVGVGLTSPGTTQAWVMNEESIRAACVTPPAASQCPPADETEVTAPGCISVWQPVNHDANAESLQLMPYALLRVHT